MAALFVYGATKTGRNNVSQSCLFSAKPQLSLILISLHFEGMSSIKRKAEGTRFRNGMHSMTKFLKSMRKPRVMERIRCKNQNPHY